MSIKAIKRELQLADLGTAPRGYLQLQKMGAVIHGEIWRMSLFPDADLDYSFDLDSIFVSIQEFFWTLNSSRSGARGGS